MPVGPATVTSSSRATRIERPTTKPHRSLPISRPYDPFCLSSRTCMSIMTNRGPERSERDGKRGFVRNWRPQRRARVKIARKCSKTGRSKWVLLLTSVSLRI
jgi:hypothetical protein